MKRVVAVVIFGAAKEPMASKCAGIGEYLFNFGATAAIAIDSIAYFARGREEYGAVDIKEYCCYICKRLCHIWQRVFVQQGRIQ